MNARLEKEFHPLRLPCALALVAAVSWASAQTVGRFTSTEVAGNFIVQFWFDISPYVLLLCLGFIAPLAYGTEFHQRTLALLLSQPISRSKIWWEKTRTIFISVIIPSLIYFVTLYFFLPYFPFDPNAQLNTLPFKSMLITGAFLFASVAASGFWILLARSTIGGMTLGVGGLFFVFMGAIDLADRIYPKIDFDAKNIYFLVGGALLYGAIFLGLGWRKFVRYQLKFAFGERGGAGVESFAGFRLDFAWLRCRSAGPMGNLLRKEIRLNKSLFLIATVFTICWLLSLAVWWLFPRRRELLVPIFHVLDAVYIPLLFVIAGGVSLSEEKSLGLGSSYLTLPISLRFQWLIKLFVGFLISMLLGIALPVLLAHWTGALVDREILFLNERSAYWLMILPISCLIYVVGFWVSTMVDNVVHVAFSTIVAVAIALGCCALASYWLSEPGNPFDGILSMLLVIFELPPDYFLHAGWCSFSLFTVLIISILLVQSLAQFRRIQSRRYILFRNSAIVTMFCFLCAYFFVGIGEAAATIVRGQLQSEVQSGLTALPPISTEYDAKHPRIVRLEELKATYNLSPLTVRWLRHASILVISSPVKGVDHINYQLQHEVAQSQSDAVRYYSPGYHYYVKMVFPKSRTYTFYIDVQRPSNSRR